MRECNNCKRIKLHAELRLKFMKANKRAPNEAEREAIRREVERIYPRRK